MTVALALAVMAVAVVLVWRGTDVRVVLLAAALVIGAIASQPGVVFRKAAEALCDPKFVTPICSAMGFAYVMRETGCVEALVRVLSRAMLRGPRFAVPGAATVAFIVNMAIPSQTSTLAAVGPLLLALLARTGTTAPVAGTALVFGASIGGALLNPGLAEVIAVAGMAALPAPELVVRLAPGVLVAFVAGLAVLLLLARRARTATEPPLTVDSEGERVDVLPARRPVEPAPESAGAPVPSAYKALLPPLPIVWLLLGHPALPTHEWVARAMPSGLEVFTAMLAGSALAIAFASRDRSKTTRAMFEGMGYAFANVITIIAVSAATAKALEVAGVLRSFVNLTHGNPAATLAAAFLLAFALAVVSGSGTASSVALVAAFGAHTAELGITPLALGGVVLMGAEAGRTTSPVAAVLLFGSSLVTQPPRVLAQRLLLPCLIAAATGAVVCAWRFS